MMSMARMLENLDAPLSWPIRPGLCASWA